MKLLLSNDDGVFSEGIRALAVALNDGNELFISAPDTERSCVSRGMTLFSPLRAKPVTLAGLEQVPAYAVSGTPVDCVRLGLGNLFPAPDIVVSGINIGSNLGTDVLYSGTVAAAHEAALLGFQAIAVSICSFSPKHLKTAGEMAKKAVAFVRKHPLPFGTVLNVNVPDLPLSEIAGVQAASLGIVRYKLQFVEGNDPFGVPYYWPPRGRLENGDETETDDRLSSRGFVTVTPLTFDMTDEKHLTSIDPAAFLE